MDLIPSLDLAHFENGSEQQKQQFVKDLGEAYERIGFASVKNHLLTPDIESALYQQVKAFFDLPKEIKMKYSGMHLAGQRGYTSFGTEKAKGSDAHDLKEFWHFGQDVTSGNDLGYPPNLVVEELPEFNKVGMQAFHALERTGKIMLRAMALYLGLEETYFDKRIELGNSILRPIHYGPITEDPGDSVRAGQHEDINLITLLMGASAEGLEVLRKDGTWIPITALPDQLVVNVGDMLQRLTNRKFVSTTHRVVNPPREKWAEPRYSIPFFLHPRSEVSLRCLDSCVDDNHPREFSDLTAGEYLEERLREIGLLK